MYYALVFYIRWALRPAVLVLLSVNLTKGERNSALRADDIRPYGDGKKPNVSVFRAVEGASPYERCKGFLAAGTFSGS